MFVPIVVFIASSMSSLFTGRPSGFRCSYLPKRPCISVDALRCKLGLDRSNISSTLQNWHPERAQVSRCRPLCEIRLFIIVDWDENFWLFTDGTEFSGNKGHLNSTDFYLLNESLLVAFKQSMQCSHAVSAKNFGKNIIVSHNGT